MKNRDKLFKELHHEFHNKLLRLCQSYSGNQHDAEDLVQEVFLKIWKNLHLFNSKSAIGTWIFRIATNTCLMFVKKQQRTRDFEIKEIETVVSDETTESSIVDKKKKLFTAISSLREMDRIIISLVLEGLSYKEIAEILGSDTNNVGVKINRIKKQLAKKMKL